MRKLLLLPLAVLTILSACNAEEKQQSDAVQESSSEIVISTPEKEKIKTMSSSQNTPLKTGEWGIAAKYSTSDQLYANVPVKITSVTYGENAEKTVRSFMNENPEYVYTKPLPTEQWAVAEYELSLDGFPLDETGADASITSFVTAEDGGTITVDEKIYNPFTVNIIDGQYRYEGIVSGKIAFRLPKNCGKYLIVVGEFEETQAFFLPD